MQSFLTDRPQVVKAINCISSIRTICVLCLSLLSLYMRGSHSTNFTVKFADETAVVDKKAYRSARYAPPDKQNTRQSISKAEQTIKDLHHSDHIPVQWLPSSGWVCCLRSRSERLRRSFFPACNTSHEDIKLIAVGILCTQICSYCMCTCTFTLFLHVLIVYSWKLL